MAVVYHGGGRPYSTDFLTQMSDDLVLLAEDMRRAGCAQESVFSIQKAARVVRSVRAENENQED